jgi:hypothetical protein
MAAQRRGPVLAALPIAAAATLLLVRWLPIEFAYRPNDLGIVSLATLAQYPMQQEMFWYVFALVVGTLLAWALAPFLRRAGPDVRAIVQVEALSAACLVAVLWLPIGLGAAVGVAAAAAALWLASRGSAGENLPPAEPLPAPPRRRPMAAWAWVVGALAFTLLLAPGFWAGLWIVAHDVPDAQLMYDGFTWLGETGQHLAWTNAIWNGGFQGRDFFCLYGPLYDLSLAGFWKVVGRSVAAYDLYWSLARVLGWLSLFLLGGAMLRRPWLVIAMPLLLPWVQVRVGFALFGLFCLWLWMRSETPRAERSRGVAWCALAGVVGGIGLFYSQEYGAVFGVLAAATFAIRRAAFPALTFALGMVAVVAPLLLWFAANDALGPMLNDLVQYPRYLMAGYAKMIFPPLASALPLQVSALGSEESLYLRLSHAVPLVYWAGLMLALPVSALDPRRPLESLREVLASLARDPMRLLLVLIALLGLASFRVALGRSHLPRTLAVLPAAVLLLGYAIDRLVDLWQRGDAARVLARWRTAALVVFVLMAGFGEAPYPFKLVWKTVTNSATLLTRGYEPKGERHVLRVTRWVQLNTEPGEPVLFLPDDGAYYYLTDRPNPIRFVMGHQIVTDAHRAEVLADLEAAPPRFVVWDHDAYRVDELPDELVFGPGILAFLRDNYRTETRIRGVEVLRHIGSQPE